jgi:hypothetical protein
MSSWNKLQPIYLALDNHQYTKAIKLCVQQPPSNVLARALLAHALIKAGQRSKSLQTMAAILDDNIEFFPELQWELIYSQQNEAGDGSSSQQQQQQQQQSQAQPAASVSAKKGKKSGNKKKAAPATATNASAPVAAVSSSQGVTLDWVDRLDKPPQLPENWDRLPSTCVDWLQDEHILSTMALTMHKHLKLPLTAFQLYRWSITCSNSSTTSQQQQQQMPELLVKAYLAGFPLLLAPQYARQTAVTKAVLHHMQALSLQYARHHSSLGTLWAAQTCIWQVELLPTESESARNSQLLRLAESLAARGLQDSSVDPMLQSEYFMLYVKALDLQDKMDEKLAAIVTRLGGSVGEDDQQLVYPPRRTLLDLQAETLQKIGDYRQGEDILTTQLRLYPDNWSLWKRHAECAEKNDDRASTYRFAEELNGQEQQYLLRGPLLILVELRYQEALKHVDDDEYVTRLSNQLNDYIGRVAPHALCCCADITPYMDWIMSRSARDERHAQHMLDWLQSHVQLRPVSQDSQQRRQELRQYITAIQINHKILVHVDEPTRQKNMPDWKEMLQVWKDFQLYDVIQADDQKENRPADELILLVVQQLLASGSDDENTLVTIASILEAGMSYSPYNGHLKIVALRVYGILHAATRAYDLFRGLSIKHIQYESCTYLILPILRANGLYEETVSICKEIVRLQRISLNEACDYTGKAMENGVRSKADEFIRFHRTRMNGSLTALEARGLILDAAPMFGQTDEQWVLGAFHGLVGCEADFDRATQMITEAHDPLGAFNILQLSDNVDDSLDRFSDNRDLELLSNEPLFPRDVATTGEIVNDSIRRGHVHSLLIRAALCVAATKGPKKGKLVEPSNDGKKRCSSLLAAVATTLSYCSTSSPKQPHLLKALMCGCRIITGLNTGCFADSEASTEVTLEGREERIMTLLAEKLKALQEARRELALQDSGSIQSASCLLPESIVPIWAIFRMCAVLFDMFGWGRRKRNTKRCAGALAEVAAELTVFVREIKHTVVSLPKPYKISDCLKDMISQDTISESVCLETVLLIRRSQETTYERITSLCDEMTNILETFDIDD